MLRAGILRRVVRYLLTGPPFRLAVLPNWLDVTAGAAIAVAYLALSWAATGRSVGKQIAGLREEALQRMTAAHPARNGHRSTREAPCSSDSAEQGASCQTPKQTSPATVPCGRS